MKNKFIDKTNLKVDLNKVRQEVDSLVNLCPWPKGNQLGLKHRPQATDVWTDAYGSLADSGFVESEFTEWNPNCPPYIKEIIQELETQFNFKSGRVRLMRLMPRSGLSVHMDDESRYHLVIKTNPFCYMFEVNSSNVPIGTHMPADGYFYWVATTEPHFVYNGSFDDRIHLVINELKNV